MIPSEQARACRHAIGHKVRGLVSESYVTAAPRVKAALAEELGTLLEVCVKHSLDRSG